MTTAAPRAKMHKLTPNEEKLVNAAIAIRKQAGIDVLTVAYDGKHMIIGNPRTLLSIEVDPNLAEERNWFDRLSNQIETELHD